MLPVIVLYHHDKIKLTSKNALLHYDTNIFVKIFPIFLFPQLEIAMLQTILQ